MEAPIGIERDIRPDQICIASACGMVPFGTPLIEGSLQGIAKSAGGPGEPAGQR